MVIKLANKKNYGTKRTLGSIEYIVVHYTANDGDTANSNANYFANTVVSASAHYFVDDLGAVQSVPDDYVAWSVGGKKYNNCWQTGGGTFYGKCTNLNSISVELCDTQRNGKYDFSEKTLANAVRLVSELMKKYKVPRQKVIRHFDVTGKKCPAPFVENAERWENFKKRLGDNEMVEDDEIVVDGKKYVVELIRKDGVTYIKTRDIAELVGYSVGNKGRTPILNKKQ